MNIGDRYKIERQLSQNGGRYTLLAKDTQSQASVIIKLLRFGNLPGWDDSKLFEREAKTLKNLDIREIPKYIDYFEVDNEHCRGFALVQEYIDAPSLKEVIQQGRKFTEAELIELADQLLTVLDRLHSYHPPIIHRDIKPSNILISNRSGNSIGKIHLIDFGSVQTAASSEMTVVGTSGYIPWEQFSGKAVAASDLYAVGMTLRYLSTGIHPNR